MTATTTQPQLRIPYGVADFVKLRLGNEYYCLNGNFSRLREIIETGEQVGEIKTRFPAESLLQQDNFISLLYYFGLLTFAGEREGRALLRIPNRTVRQLMYGYLR